MFVLSLCKQLCPDRLPVQPGERLGDGADGEVLTIVGSPDRVIKLGIIYDNPMRELSHYSTIQQILDYLMLVQPRVYARVHEHGYLGQYTRKVLVDERNWGEQPFVMYYYIMEKLQALSPDEKKVFHSIMDHEDSGIIKDYSISKIEIMLRGMKRGLDFDEKKVMLFCSNLQLFPILHLDIATRNIMKDASGNYKLIDFDRSEIICPKK